MKVIVYTKQIIKQTTYLVYATCTNDLIIYSKQASNVELFVLAFLIECNRLFIADSILINVLQKRLYLKAKSLGIAKNNLQKSIGLKLQNFIPEFFSGDNQYENYYAEENMIN
jgi:uncharacterized protein with PQ loop repeat